MSARSAIVTALAAGLSLAAVPASAEVAVPDRVHVELRGDDPRIRLDRVVEGGRTEPICLAPCGRLLDRRATYVIQGDGVVKTSRFVLPAAGQPLILDVQAGSYAARYGGWALVVLGSAAMAAGYALSPADAPPEDRSRATPWPAVLDLSGIAFAGLGLALLLWEAPTRVQSSSGASFTAAPAAPRRRPLVALTARGLEF